MDENIEREIEKKINQWGWVGVIGIAIISLSVMYSVFTYGGIVPISLELIFGIILAIYGYSQEEHWKRELIRIQSK